MFSSLKASLRLKKSNPSISSRNSWNSADEREAASRGSPSPISPISPAELPAQPLLQPSERDELLNPRPPTRRPVRAGFNAFTVPSNEPPPAYTPSPTAESLGPFPAYTTAVAAASGAEDPYAFLTTFDTILVIDDSGFMAGRSWRETAHALTALLPTIVAHDTNGTQTANPFNSADRLNTTLCRLRIPAPLPPFSYSLSPSNPSSTPSSSFLHPPPLRFRSTHTAPQKYRPCANASSRYMHCRSTRLLSLLSVTPDVVEAVWPLCSHLLAPQVERSPYSKTVLATRRAQVRLQARGRLVALTTPLDRVGRGLRRVCVCPCHWAECVRLAVHRRA